MIIALVGLLVLLLFFLGYYLTQKQEVFFSLIPHIIENERFLYGFGLAYAFLGIAGLFVAFFNHKIVTLGFLFVVLLIAAIFSILFAGKMKQPK